MNLGLSNEQSMMVESFALFLKAQSSSAQVRQAAGTGFDGVLWRGVAEMGGFGLRVPEVKGGLGLGLFDAVLVTAELGRALATGPLIEGVIVAGLLSRLSDATADGLCARLIAGDAVVTLALKDVGTRPEAIVRGARVAEQIIACDGDTVFMTSGGAGHPAVKDRAGLGLGRVNFGQAPRQVLAQGPQARAAFDAAIEEWKLLSAAALAALSQEAINMAAAYAVEREAFGRPIGTYQGVSHPLADLATEAEGGRLVVWKAISDIAAGEAHAGASVSMALWWNATTADRATAQALHTFGGYGLTTDYDVHLFNLRAKGWPLVLGDPSDLLSEAGRRLFGQERVSLPDSGLLPIDFGRDAESRTLAGEVDAFFTATLTPALKQSAHYSFDGHDAGVHRALAEAGLLFPDWPVEDGGRAASPYATSAALGVWEDHDWTIHAAATTNMVGSMIRRFGGDRLKSEVLTRVRSGESVCSLGFSEPGCGSDVFATRTRAARDGDDWVIDGQKMFTSGANVADYVLLIARTDPEAAKHKGLTMFIVPLDAPGVTIQAVETFQDERTNITFYDAVRVPDAYRLGDVDGGSRVMAAGLEMEHGANFLATQRRMLAAAEQVCRETVVKDALLIDQPDVVNRLARVAAHNVVTEALCGLALWSAAERLPHRGQGSMAKLFSSEKFRTDAADLLDLTAPASLDAGPGAAGFLNQCFRHAQGTTIYAGTSEVHRSVIAERALGLPRTRN